MAGCCAGVPRPASRKRKFLKAFLQKLKIVLKSQFFFFEYNHIGIIKNGNKVYQINFGKFFFFSLFTL